MLAGASEQVGGDVVGGVNYSTAATEEVQYQLYNVPRVSFWVRRGCEILDGVIVCLLCSSCSTI